MWQGASSVGRCSASHTAAGLLVVRSAQLEIESRRTQAEQSAWRRGTRKLDYENGGVELSCSAVFVLVLGFKDLGSPEVK